MASASELTTAAPATSASTSSAAVSSGVASALPSRAGWGEAGNGRADAVPEEGKPALFIPTTLLLPVMPASAPNAGTAVKAAGEMLVAPLISPPPTVAAAPMAKAGASGNLAELQVQPPAPATPSIGISREATVEVDVDGDDVVEVEDETEGAVQAALAIAREHEPSHEVAEVEDVEDVDDVDDADEADEFAAPKLEPSAKRHKTAPMEAVESRPAAEPRVAPPPPPAKVVRETRRPWHIDFFALGGGAVSSLAGRREAAKDVDFIHAALGEPERATLLDVCCGDGRHCFEFATKGYDVRGLELSEAQLRRAAQRNGGRAVPLEFIEADMRTMALERTFDVITCLGSSLGYGDDEGDRTSLIHMREHLVRGGKLVLHVFNRDYVVSNVPCRSWWSSEGALVLDEVDFDFTSDHLRVHRTMISDDGQQHEHFMSIRSYSLHELTRLVASVGFRVISVSGSRATRGYYFGSSSPDLWIVAENRG
jgi:SAM-dependent methyltransferase